MPQSCSVRHAWLNTAASSRDKVERQSCMCDMSLRVAALLTACRWNDFVEQFGTGTLPDLPDNGSEFLVDVINVA